jgi:hypothetical protein
MKNISRREFLKYLGIGALGVVAKPKLSWAARKGASRASTVVQCFDENSTSGSSINEPVVQIMMDRSIEALAGMGNVGEAWKSVFPGITENSVISIKVNCINWRLSTHPEFVNCIVNGLIQMDFGGINFPKNNIIVWDRTDGELTSAGYTIYDGNDPNTVRCFGTNHSGIGYDMTCPLTVDYPSGTITKYPSRIMSQMCDYAINAGVLKDHSQGIITLTMKNHYGSINQPVENELHNSNCNPSIPSVNQQIRDVIAPNNIQKIFIIDCLFGRINWGPGGSPNCNPKKLLMSLDTVACDYQGQNMINEERQAQGYPTIDAPHITTASQAPYNLGTTDINLIEIDNPSGIAESKHVVPSDGALNVIPNPFRRKTTIIISLKATSVVYLDLINPAGRIKSKIYSGQLTQGKHHITYNVGKKLSRGTYFIRLHSEGKTRVKKVTILN